MSVEEVIEDPPLAWYNPWSYVPKWCPTSMSLLAAAERNLLSKVWPLIESRHVFINKGENHLRTISLNTEAQRTPLVLVHGMGSGVALWAMNLESLSKRRTLHAFDVLGFGRSSRPGFSKDGMIAEMEFVESIEEWRREMKLDKFVLLGHSLGGFLAASYALRYPDRLKHLILVDPWGFPERPMEADTPRRIPTWMRAIAAILQPFNPLAGLRVAGPLGPNIVRRFRPDLLRKFSDAAEEEAVAAYIYHCNVQNPSGETGFKNMTLPYGWAKYPMIRRIKDIPNNLPMTFVYGSRSWIDSSVGYEIKYLRNEAYVDVQVIKGAGHHIYADRTTEFNDLVNKICSSVDSPVDSDNENDNLPSA